MSSWKSTRPRSVANDAAFEFFTLKIYLTWRGRFRWVESGGGGAHCVSCRGSGLHGQFLPARFRVESSPAGAKPARKSIAEMRASRGDSPPGLFDFLISNAPPSRRCWRGQDGSPDYLFQTNMVGAYHCLEKSARLEQPVFCFSPPAGSIRSLTAGSASAVSRGMPRVFRGRIAATPSALSSQGVR